MNSLKSKLDFRALKGTPFLAVSKLERQLACGLIGSICRFFVKNCTNLKVHQLEILNQAIASDRPLITISNHDSTLDDPLTFVAQEICFKNRFLNWFFSAGQAIPILRGNGINQPGMDQAIHLLNQNQWVHLYPEGKINFEPEKELVPFRWGVGRLIMESQKPPIIIPFYHRGMQSIFNPLTYHQTGLKFGKRLDILIGNQLDFNDINFKEFDSSHTRAIITSRIQKEMNRLKTIMDQMHLQ